MHLKYLLAGLLLLLQVKNTSGKTYTISPESFIAQFAQVAHLDYRSVTTQDPFGGRTTYKTHPLEAIEVVDKKGNLVRLQTGPALEIRFTDTAGKRTVFYFDLISVDAATVTGSISRIFPNKKKTVFLGAVKRIEIQNGGKRFQYVRY